MIRVIIESPFGTRPDGGRASPEEMERNVVYLKRAIADSLARDEAPFASHGFYPLVLDDATSDERRQGMEAGFAWGSVAQRAVIYTDYGITEGMREGISRALSGGLVVSEREIGKNSLVADVVEIGLGDK